MHKFWVSTILLLLSQQYINMESYFRFYLNRKMYSCTYNLYIILNFENLNACMNHSPIIYSSVV